MKPLAFIFSMLLVAQTAMSGLVPKDFDITRWGAIGDGKTLNTAAIQKAIDLCSEQGGGRVIIPDGTWLSGTLMLKNDVTLFLNEKATLLGSTNIADYQLLDGFKDGRGSNMGYCFVGGADVKNCGIAGTGKIDGNGKLLLEKNGRGKRPFLVRFVRCANISVADIHMGGPAAWTMHLFECTNARADQVFIKSRGLSNNDGIDVDCCDGVTIQNCNIDSGDDAICLKATGSKPCKNIDVFGCRLNTNQGAFKIGTETYGDFENIRFHDCKIDTTKGIKIYSVDGAHLKNLTISDIEIEKTSLAVMIRLGSRLKTFREGDPKKSTGSIESLTLKGIKVNYASQIAILISGIPSSDIRDVTISDLSVLLNGGGKAEDAKTILAENETDYPEVTMFGKIMPAYGIFIRHAEQIKLDHINLTTQTKDERPAILIPDHSDVTCSGMNMVTNDNIQPVDKPQKK
ncbi:MAG: glycosyl hydrolase family 28 protein [Bacteroidota bacterium]|nr:glycosyl hydrolase family 28 protein [Bacteroidota bacterium]